MKKRAYEISLLNVFFALLVIFIHISSDPVSVLDKAELPYMVILSLWRLSTFVVPGFIFLSGFKMFYSMTDKIDYKRFYLSKLKKIVFPYVVWVIIYYLCYIALGFFKGENHILNIIKYTLTGNLAAHFYFIIAIMQFYILAPLWILIKNKISPKIYLPAAFITGFFCCIYLPQILYKNGIVFNYNDRIFTTYIFYFAAGIFVATHYEKFTDFMKKNFKWVALLFVLFAGADSIVTYLWQTNIKVLPIIDHTHFLYSCIAIFFFYGMALKCKRLYDFKLIKSIDGASYYIYLVHLMFLLIIDKIMVDAGILAVKSSYPIRAVVVYGLSLTLCIGYVKLKKMKLFYKKV